MKTKQLLAQLNQVVTASAVVQTGTSGSPFLASNATKLISPLNQSIPSGLDASYIKFTSDIYYDFTGQVVNKNTDIDGNNFRLNYTGSSYTAIHFSVTLSNLQLTLKNINYTTASIYYGIMTFSNNSTNNILNIENVTYNVSHGGEP